jgi:hypothetical protein
MFPKASEMRTLAQQGEQNRVKRTLQAALNAYPRYAEITRAKIADAAAEGRTATSVFIPEDDASPADFHSIVSKRIVGELRDLGYTVVPVLNSYLSISWFK